MVPFQNSFTNRLSSVIYLTLYLCAVAVILFAILCNKCREIYNTEMNNNRVGKGGGGKYICMA